MSRQTRLISWLVIFVMLVGVMQMACALTGKSTPTPGAEEQATSTVKPEEPEVTNTPAGPTPTPLPPLPPQVVGRSPARGEEATVDGPLVIRFDQPMERSSVEDAFSIAPAVEGRFEWADDQTLLFRPEGSLDRQARYDVVIAETAASAAGLQSTLPL